VKLQEIVVNLDETSKELGNISAKITTKETELQDTIAMQKIYLEKFEKQLIEDEENLDKNCIELGQPTLKSALALLSSLETLNNDLSEEVKNVVEPMLC